MEERNEHNIGINTLSLFFNKFPCYVSCFSLLVPCYDFSLKAIHSSVYAGYMRSSPLTSPKLPVNFPVIGNFAAETGSQQTASSAI
jgi:hypothetical protein